MRKTCDGNGTENSAAKSTSPLSMNRSMRSLTSAVIGSSRRAIFCGAKMGSSSLRNFLWSGGSICSGMSGRWFCRSTASAFDENTSGLRSASSISTRRVSTTISPRSITGMESRRSL